MLRKGPVKKNVQIWSYQQILLKANIDFPFLLDQNA